jgi:hypothetical protein
MLEHSEEYREDFFFINKFNLIFNNKYSHLIHVYSGKTHLFFNRPHHFKKDMMCLVRSNTYSEIFEALLYCYEVYIAIRLAFYLNYPF